MGDTSMQMKLSYQTTPAALQMLCLGDKLNKDLSPASATGSDSKRCPDRDSTLACSVNNAAFNLYNQYMLCTASLCLVFFLKV